MLRITTTLLSTFMLTLLPGAAPGSDNAVPVEIVKVELAEINRGHRVVGTVEPLRKVTVGTAMAGRVGDFKVNSGQPVKAGDTLVQLRTETLEIEKAAADARLDLYVHRLAELENGSRKEDVDAAEATMLGALAAMENAAARLTRMEELAASKAATLTDIEDAEERAMFTLYAHSAATATLKRIKAGPRLEQVAQAKAEVELQRQNVRAIEDRLFKHTIVAPFDGYVSAEYTEDGAWVASGDPIVQIIQLNEVEIVAPAPAEMALKLRLGETIRIEFPELPDRLITGNVERIVPIAETRARTFPIIIRAKNELRNSGPMLMSGMLARIDLPAGKRQLLPLVPKDSLVLSEGEQSVFVVDLDDGGKLGTVREVPVELGVAVDNLIQVDGEITVDDHVVVIGNERLLDGNRVKVVTSPE